MNSFGCASISLRGLARCRRWQLGPAYAGRRHFSELLKCRDNLRMKPVSEGNAFTEDEGISHGLYLAVGDDVASEGRTYSSLPFIVGLPSWDFEERSWCYEVIAEPKPGERAPSDDAPTPAPTPSAGKYILANFLLIAILGIRQRTRGRGSRRRDGDAARSNPGHAKSKTASAVRRSRGKCLVDRQGFEPWTLGLRVPCSTS